MSNRDIKLNDVLSLCAHCLAKLGQANAGDDEVKRNYLIKFHEFSIHIVVIRQLRM